MAKTNWRSVDGLSVTEIVADVPLSATIWQVPLVMPCPKAATVAVPDVATTLNVPFSLPSLQILILFATGAGPVTPRRLSGLKAPPEGVVALMARLDGALG